MKSSQVLSKLVLMIVLVITVAFVVCYFFGKSADNRLKENSSIQSTTEKYSEKRLTDYKENTETRFSEFRENEKRFYDSILDQVKNDKMTFYIIMIASNLIFLLILLHLIQLLTPFNMEILIFPRKYDVIPKQEAEALKYLKYELIKAKILTEQQPLLKENIVKLLGPPRN